MWQARKYATFGSLGIRARRFNRRAKLCQLLRRTTKGKGNKTNGQRTTLEVARKYPLSHTGDHFESWIHSLSRIDFAFGTVISMHQDTFLGKRSRSLSRSAVSIVADTIFLHFRRVILTVKLLYFTLFLNYWNKKTFKLNIISYAIFW